MVKIIEYAKRNIKYHKDIRDRMLINIMAIEVGQSIREAKERIVMHVNENGILSCRIDPQHYIEDILADTLAEEHPINIIIIESRRGCFVKKRGQDIAVVRQRMELIIEKLEAELRKMPIEFLDIDDKLLLEILDSKTQEEEAVILN